MGSDVAQSQVHYAEDISIHAPRMGSDQQAQQTRKMAQIFQSTLPAWGATGI